MAIARYTLAVDRRGRRGQDGGEQTADFINCVAFDRAGEFAEKYFRQGMRVLVSGRLQTGSYVNQEGNKVYATNVIVEEHYFTEGKKLSGAEKKEDTDPDGFMHLPDGEDFRLSKKNSDAESRRAHLYTLQGMCVLRK